MISSPKMLKILGFICFKYARLVDFAAEVIKSKKSWEILMLVSAC